MKRILFVCVHMERVREIRDEIKAGVMKMLEEMDRQEKGHISYWFWGFSSKNLLEAEG